VKCFAICFYFYDNVVLRQLDHVLPNSLLRMFRPALTQPTNPKESKTD